MNYNHYVFCSPPQQRINPREILTFKNKTNDCQTRIAPLTYNYKSPEPASRYIVNQKDDYLKEKTNTLNQIYYQNNQQFINVGSRINISGNRNAGNENNSYGLTPKKMINESNEFLNYYDPTRNNVSYFDINSNKNLELKNSQPIIYYGQNAKINVLNADNNNVINKNFEEIVNENTIYFNQKTNNILSTDKNSIPEKKIVENLKEPIKNSQINAQNPNNIENKLKDEAKTIQNCNYNGRNITNNYSYTDLRTINQNKANIKQSTDREKTPQPPSKIETILKNNKVDSNLTQDGKIVYRSNVMSPKYQASKKIITQNYNDSQNEKELRKKESIDEKTFKQKSKDVKYENDAIANFIGCNINTNNLNKKQKTDENPNFFSTLKDFSEGIVDDAAYFFNKNINKLSERKKCACDSGLGRFDNCKNGEKWIKLLIAKDKIDKMKEEYEMQKLYEPDQKNAEQIKKDIARTYPLHDFFKEGSNGMEMLERLLINFSKLDKDIGYVQGMNYIAGSLLYHLGEADAFHLMKAIFKKFQLRDIYLPKLPGLSKHLQIIDILIMTKLPLIYSHFVKKKKKINLLKFKCNNCIKSDMFCTPWIFSLFGVMIPLEEMVKFLDNFIIKGWPYFYKIIIAYLSEHEKNILEHDSTEILPLLSKNNYIRKNKEYEENLTLWKNIFKKAQYVSIDPEFINEMHKNFDPQKMTFKLKY